MLKVVEGLVSYRTKTKMVSKLVVSTSKMPKLAAKLGNDSKQLKFFDEDIEKSGFKDPAFASNKTTPLHRWVPWIAGFSSDFVKSALSRHLAKRSIVLDPFAGVGTTLVEALLNGHDVIGFEINPYAALACRTKLSAFSINLQDFLRTYNLFDRFYTDKIASNYQPKSAVPSGFKTRGKFYSDTVLPKVLIVQDFINNIKREKIRDLFRIAFASTMVTYSNYSYEPSLGQRTSAGKSNIEDFAVGETISNRLRQMLEDIEFVQSHLSGIVPQWQVLQKSYFEYGKTIGQGKVDLIITSPPYLNNYHYNRNTRPQLYWLGYVNTPQDMKPLEEQNFGTFWQTVRHYDRLDLDFKLSDNSLQVALEELRKKNPQKGVYGGLGWANYAVSYFNDCARFAEISKYLLKKGGTALVVIGNSILHGIMIPTDKYLAQIAELIGLELVEIHIPRTKRIGNSIIQSDVRVDKANDSHSLYEAIVELRKV